MRYLNSTTASSGEFEINFKCEPFAYGKTISLDLKSGVNAIDYKGTAETPTYIRLKNTGSTTINKIVITEVRRS